MKTLLWIFGVIGVILLLTGLFLIFYDYSEGFFFFEKFVEQNKNFRIPLIAVGAACLTFAAFLVQVQANSRIQEQFKIQQFESQFYKMLDLHVNNVSSFKISRYEGLGFKDNPTKHYLEGRRVFEPMVRELHYCLDYIHSCLKRNDIYDTQKLNLLGYELFFHGFSSPVFDNLKKENKGMFEVLEIFRNGFRNSQSEDRFLDIGFDQVQIKLRYVPFSGHESRLGHYFRHLYQTVKYTVSNVENGVITYEQGRQYLKILRAQLSADEQLLLYYNYRIFYGHKWDQRGDLDKVKNRFLTDYRMIHNLPLSSKTISDKVENPREHFKSYIDSLNEAKNDPLFEHGDIIHEH
jgi:hypothetical protein